MMMTTTLQLGSKFDILAMALMVMMTLLLTSDTFAFMTLHLHCMKKTLQGTTTIASTKRFTQQLLVSSIENQKPRKFPSHNHAWQQRYLELKEFHQKFGHTNVPQRYPDNPQLGKWVRAQRASYKKGKLTAERIQALEDIGFQSDVKKAMWDQRYFELKEFYQEFGHTDVPQIYPDNPQLGLWVTTQRTNYKKGKLTAEQICALEDIGFHWALRPHNTDWKQRYLELKEFYQKFGHTKVPQRYPTNPQLGYWVTEQRRRYKKGKLTAEQIQALEDVDFKWEVRKGRPKM